MTETPARQRPGRKPISGQAMTPAERKRAQREREHQAELTRQAALEAERQRQEGIKADIRARMGSELEKLTYAWSIDRLIGGVDGLDRIEAQQYVHQVLHALKRGDRHLP